MSPRLEVFPLSYLCLKCVSNLLVNCLAQEEPCDDEILTNYLSDATGEALQDIIKYVLNSTLDASTRFSCLRVALRKDVRRLDTGMFPQFYYEAILEVIRSKGSGLQHLNLHGVWLREYPRLLISVIEQLKNLKVLVIPHMADDFVLQTAIRCKQLTVLDISGECNFTRRGLMSLKSDSLKVLSIGMFGKPNVCDNMDSNDDEEVNVIVSLIKNFPNLNVLKTFSFVGAALKRLQEQDPNFCTKLKYIHDTRTSLEVLEAICNLCPHLESAHFNGPQTGVIAKLGCLSRLNSLKVSSCTADELQDFLNRHGQRLQFLKVNLLRDGVSSNAFDVSQLCVACPELRTLEFYKCTRLACLQPDNYFLCLESLEMLYCDVGDALVRYFLMNTPFLRRLLVGDIVRMTDGDMFRLCADCEFASLEELWLSNARGLTITSVELLMGHCPNLKVLGQLNGWDVSQDDMDLLRAVILSSNSDLTLLPNET